MEGCRKHCAKTNNGEPKPFERGCFLEGYPHNAIIYTRLLSSSSQSSASLVAY